MASNRIGRINEEIRQELAALIRSLKDPRVQQSMVSVTAVETTTDLRYAKVFISVLDKERTQETLKGLKSAGGWLRRELGARLRLRCTPELIFTEDTSIGYGAHIADLLAGLNIPKEDPQNDDPQDS
ncbi:MAG: 30S ribosome-binding factor RbfA [Oscillospiraceae bacterium]|nr:30S ribosome-binding factor RbfA [Oscillospiraceae bacterium]MBR2897698.1 30S ribosome-binding factor RbfA [Oscillospiraceae bacterium]MBR3850309.1 30S ribosome-binding factor RbfA [Oscillospiraceae bacterium]